MSKRKRFQKKKSRKNPSPLRTILRDSVDYGLEYGIEDGLEQSLSKGLGQGATVGIESAAVNGVEEALGDALSDTLPPGGTETAADATGSKRKKRLIFAFKLVLIALVLGWIMWRLGESAAEIRRYHWTLRPSWLAFSGAVYLLAFFPAAVFWFLSLRWFGQTVPFDRAVEAFYFSQLGKYIPGKAMVVVIRSGMVASKKVKGTVAAVCVFYETLTMMMTGAFLAALIVLFHFGEHWNLSLAVFGAMLISGLPLMPPILLRILKILRIGRNDPALSDRLRRLTWRAQAVGAGLMTLLWILFGVSLWAAIHGIGVATGEFFSTMPRFVSATALAIVLGFAVPISPGGLGVREAVLTVLLIPYFELILDMPENGSVNLRADTLALVVSLEQRIVSIVAELSMAALFLLRRFWTYLVERYRLESEFPSG